MVEPQPSKLMMRVRFPLPAPFVLCAKKFALIAQSVERILGKDEVTGSIPVKSSILEGRLFPSSGRLLQASGQSAGLPSPADDDYNLPFQVAG